MQAFLFRAHRRRVTVVLIVLSIAYTARPVSTGADEGAVATNSGVDSVKLTVDDRWHFVGGAWNQDDHSNITAPNDPGDQYFAFYPPLAFDDLEAEFHFRHPVSHCGLGFILRAQDVSHFYLVHFPCCAQHYRAKHFWAAISRVDESGWIELLQMAIVPGVASELGIWHRARIVAQDDQIQVWVDGRPGPAVQNVRHATGRIGLESWGLGRAAPIRNLKVRGRTVSAAPWNASVSPAQNWFHPSPQNTHDRMQWIPSFARAPNGELLMVFKVSEGYGGPGPTVLVRSNDNGRTWSSQETLPAELDRGTILVDGAGRLMMQMSRESAQRRKPGKRSTEPDEVWYSYSDDNGNTWSPTERAVVPPFPPNRRSDHHLQISTNVFVLKDGTQLKTVGGEHPSTTRGNLKNWGSAHADQYTIRSTDGGRTWSERVPLDGPPGTGLNLDMTEPCMVQTRDGKVLCLSRPIYSPWVWETWSDNGGVSWGPTRRGAFPSYANTMLATSGGAILVAGRMPGLGLHVSLDGGLAWKHYQIGTDIWAMGGMYEVEPDIVLFVYMDSHNTLLRAQFIELTSDGVRPVRSSD